MHRQLFPTKFDHLEVAGNSFLSIDLLSRILREDYIVVGPAMMTAEAKLVCGLITIEMTHVHPKQLENLLQCELDFTFICSCYQFTKEGG